MGKARKVDKTAIEEQYRWFVLVYAEIEGELLAIQKKLQKIHKKVQTAADKTEIKRVLEHLVMAKE